MQACTKCGTILVVGDPIIPVSPVPQLINTNTTPSAVEEGVIRATLLEMDTDLSQLKGEIARVRAMLNDLQKKHSKLGAARRRYSRQHMPLLSLIWRLPYEILSEIFICFISDSWQDDIHRFGRAVMLPGSVCKYWRNVALSTPRLWSSINCRLRENTKEDADLIRTYLSRSGNLPLSIQLKSPFNLSLSSHPIIDIFTQHAERWQHVTIETSLSMWFQVRSVKNRLPRLRSLAIYVPTNNRRIDSMPLDMFEVAPLLTDLTIGHKSALNFMVPWSQLTRLVVSPEVGLGRCYDILYSAPNLVECDFGLICSAGIEPSCAIIHLTHLCRLRIATSDQTLGPLFDHLSLPALRFLDFYSDSVIWPQTQFLSFLSRSSCSLETFILCHLAMVQNDDLVECLRHMPSLMHLELDLHAGQFMTRETLVQLTLPSSMPYSEQSDFLVPKLAFLRCFASADIPGSAFEAVIKSRWNPDSVMHNNSGIQQTHTSPLKDLQIVFDEHPDATTLLPLRECARKGLDIKVIRYDSRGNEVRIGLDNIVRKK